MNKFTNVNKTTFAAIAHRLSGIALALFLPFHFLLLGTALNNEAAFDRALVFTSLPVVKFAEWVLVVLLMLHFLLGARVLVLELTQWPSGAANRSTWVIPILVASLLAGFIFWWRA